NLHIAPTLVYLANSITLLSGAAHKQSRLEPTIRGLTPPVSPAVIRRPVGLPVSRASWRAGGRQPPDVRLWIGMRGPHLDEVPQIPYSTVAALPIDDPPPFGPLHVISGGPLQNLEDDEILLNSWAADDLGAAPGDRIELSYFVA